MVGKVQFDGDGETVILMGTKRGKRMAARYLMLIMLFALTVSAVAAGPVVRVVTVDGPINPVTVEYVRRNLTDAAARQEQLVLLEMDTPGGLDEAMRSIVKDILASPVPVAVYVTPPGARAASAGAVIAIAADICAMAPGTNIGAAHPVTLGEKPDKTMEAKIVNDSEAYVEGLARRRGRNETLAKKMVRESVSVSAETAAAERLIDLIAGNRADLLRKLDGRTFARDGKSLALRLAGAATVDHPMGTRERVLNAISNPNVAYVLLMLGFLGLFFELSTPGAILPGVIGGISLLLAFFALQTLPVNYAGILLIVLALIMFIAEIKITSYGMLTVGGIIAMIFGSLLLFESPEPYLRVSWGVVIVTSLATAAFFAFAVAKAVTAHRRQPTTGREGLLGEQGHAVSPVAPEGKVFVRGEYWDAWSDEAIAEGDKVAVVDVEGMRLKVKKSVDG
jgi:membrane-bound serine protease (ClpP class)